MDLCLYGSCLSPYSFSYLFFHHILDRIPEMVFPVIPVLYPPGLAGAEVYFPGKF